MKTFFIIFPIVLLISFTSAQTDPALTTPQDVVTSSQACNMVNCQIGHGICYMNVCHCATGFITFNENTAAPINSYCNYQQKSHMTAMLLEFFFPFGVGHFYAHNYTLGLIKLLLILSIICSLCCACCCAAGSAVHAANAEHAQTEADKNKQIEEGAKDCMKMGGMCICAGLLSICLGVWNLIDVFCYGFNIYTDGNGQPMI